MTDIYARGVTVLAWSRPNFFFLVELVGTVGLPALLLSLPVVRRSEKGLLTGAGIAAFGVVFNRFNVSLTSYGGYREFSYFPSFFEIIITLSLVAGGILLFDFLTRNLPVYHELTGEVSE